jgi:hypothetical protein
MTRPHLSLAVITYIGRRGKQLRERLFQELLDAISAHRVANRPDRFEPRKKKQRRMPYDLLMKPRAEAKLDILKGVSKTKCHSLFHLQQIRYLRYRWRLCTPPLKLRLSHCEEISVAR